MSIKTDKIKSRDLDTISHKTMHAPRQRKYYMKLKRLRN